MTYRSIQSLRAVAALIVVIFHAQFYLPRGHVQTWLQSGVDIFFVISGFVMVASTDRKVLSGSDFLVARLVRIVPLYWLALSIYLVLIATTSHVRVPIDEVIKSYSFVFYRDTLSGDPSPFLSPGWSLNYEMYFYILFALLIKVPVRIRIAILACYFALAVGFRHHFSESSALGFRLTSPMPLEFVAGMIIAYFRDRIVKAPPTLGIALVLAGVAGLALASRAEPRIIFYGVPAAIIVCGAVMAEPWFAGRAADPAVALGDASYSLYLSHAILLRSLAVTSLAPFTGTLGLLIAISACVAASFLVYRYVERSLTKMVRSVVMAKDRRLAVAPWMPPA